MFSKRNTQSFVIEKYGECSSPVSGTKMGEYVTRLLLLVAVWHKVLVMHTEGVWVTLLCPAAACLSCCCE